MRPAHPTVRLGWLAVLATAAGWVALGLIATSITWGNLTTERSDVGFGRIALLTVPYWLFYAVATPLVVSLGNRFPLERGRWTVSGPVHLLASVTVAAIHQLLYTWLTWRLFPFPNGEATPPFWVLFRGYASSRWHFEVLLYWAILGTATALRYHREVANRDRAQAELTAQLGEAKLRALRMQLQPHFLFNTLQTISMLTVADPVRAQRMLTLLGDLLRRILETDDRGQTTLAEELEFLDRYLAIEETRFSDRLTVHRDIDPAARPVLVPSFILQPIVENAIRYGVAPKAAPGAIEIAATVAGDRLRLTVRDHGAGPPPSVEPGIGLTATRARLESAYGDRYQLSLRAAEGGGAVVELDLPAGFR